MGIKNKPVAQNGNETPKEEQQPAPVTPVAPNNQTPIKVDNFEPTNANISEPVLKRGEVLVVPVDTDGNELTGRQFVTSEYAATNYYNDTKKFLIKKKA